MITSKDNPRVKRVVQLSSSARKRRENGQFLLEGTRLCEEALREDILVSELYYTGSVATQHADLVTALVARSAVAEEVSEAVFEKMSDTCSPQGILLVASFAGRMQLPEHGRFLAFERVSDPANLGAAARTAEALGFAGLILAKEGVDPYSPKSLRASMGALLRLPILYCDDFVSTLCDYRQKGFMVSGTVVDRAATPIQSVAFGRDEIAVIGNEANGMTSHAKSVCDRLLTIPMPGRAESLNAAVAAAIVMWEMSR